MPRSRASAQAMRQLASLACRPATVRATSGLAGRTASAARACPGGGTPAQQAVRRFLSAEAGAGAGGARTGVATTRTARCVAAALGPSGTKMQLALARALMHDDLEARDLLGEGDDLEDT